MDQPFITQNTIKVEKSEEAPLMFDHGFDDDDSLDGNDDERQL